MQIPERFMTSIQGCVGALATLDETPLPDDVEWDESSETAKQIEDIIKAISRKAIMEVHYGNNLTMKATVDQYNAMAKHFLDTAYKAYDSINGGTGHRHHRAKFTVNAEMNAINHHIATLRDHTIEHCVQGINYLLPLIGKYGSG